MKKILAAISALSVGLACIAQPALARFQLHFASDLPSGGTAYEWYVPGLLFHFDVENRDGLMPTGEAYTLFKGTDASPKGHCLEVSFLSTLGSPDWMQVKVNDHGTYRTITNPNLADGGYPTMRLWVHRNTASGSLNWALYLTGPDGSGFSGTIEADVRRLEVSKAGCTTAQVGGVAVPGSAMPWVAFEGNSASYTVTKGNF